MNARYDYYNDPFYYTGPSYRYRRGDQYYTTNDIGIGTLKQALNQGYKEGYRAGRADHEDRWRFDPRSSFAYQDANFGYDGRYVAQDEYNYYFREGFRARLRGRLLRPPQVWLRRRRQQRVVDRGRRDRRDPRDPGDQRLGIRRGRHTFQQKHASVAGTEVPAMTPAPSAGPRGVSRV
jgi:hypothetical protein